MIEILPIKSLRDEDSLIFGSLNVALGKLARLELPVASGVVVTAPQLHLKTLLEHFDYTHTEVFEQTLTLVKKEIEKTPVPGDLVRETGKNSYFMVNGETLKSVRSLWLNLLFVWLGEIKGRLWKDGFYPGITQDLEPKLVIFLNKPESLGSAYFDSLQDDVVIHVSEGPLSKTRKLHPNDLRKLDQLVREANKKLLIPHEYEWIIDRGLKLAKVLPYTPPVIQTYNPGLATQIQTGIGNSKEQSAVKVFLDLSKGLVVEKDADGIYISTEEIFDLNKPNDSFEQLVFKLVECGATFFGSPILVKLADMSEGMGKVRGTLRLIHQKSLLDPICEAVLFARNKKDLINIHLVIPFVRGVNELMQIKGELATKKLSRKNSLQQWLELSVPENIINLEEYLITGVDGVVLNLDELSAHFNGYDHTQSDLSFYKHEVAGLLKILEDGVKLMHKSKVPFLAYGSLSLNPVVLEFLVEKGVYGIVVERYEAPSMVDLLKQAEKRMILKRAS